MADAFTVKQIEVAAKAYWEHENDIIDSSKQHVIAATGPYIRHAWRDKRLPKKYWETRLEHMRAALTEMLIHG